MKVPTDTWNRLFILFIVLLALGMCLLGALVATASTAPPSATTIIETMLVLVTVFLFIVVLMLVARA